MDSVENKIAARLVLQLREENEWLTSVNDRLHKGLRDYGKMVDDLRQEHDALMGKISQDAQRLKDDHHLIICLRETIDDLRKEIARLSASPQWERERDCCDVNDECTN